MEPAGVSTTIMLALAAVLWFLYFVPSWIRRREYLATERTATRLQRTVRIMAEAAEAPEAVRLEATAREAARAERMRLAVERRIAREAMREAEAAAAARAEIAAARQRAEAARAATGAPPAPAPAARRLRRARLLAGLLLIAALAVGGSQLVLMATAGIAVGAWVVLAACAATVAASIALQRRIRERSRPSAPAARVAPRPAAVDVPLERAAPRRDWTPVPVPRPRYIEHPEAAPLGPALGAPTMDAAARLRVAAAAAARQEELPRVAPRPQPRRVEPVETPAEPSRYASMGIVGDVDSAIDLDEVLRRRRVG